MPLLEGIKQGDRRSLISEPRLICRGSQRPSSHRGRSAQAAVPSPAAACAFSSFLPYQEIFASPANKSALTWVFAQTRLTSGVVIMDRQKPDNPGMNRRGL